MTSSPGPMAAAVRAEMRAPVPELVARAKRAPVRWTRAESILATPWPREGGRAPSGMARGPPSMASFSWVVVIDGMVQARSDGGGVAGEVRGGGLLVFDDGGETDREG